MSKEDKIEKFTKIAQETREILTDFNFTMALVKTIIESYADEMDGMEELGREIFVNLASLLLEDSFRNIHKHAESPIELLFLGSTAISFAMNGPISVAFTPPLNVEQFSAHLREDYESSLSIWEQSKELHGKEDMGQLEEDLRTMEVEDSMIARILRHIMLYNMFDLYNGFHFTLQPKMNIKVKGKKIRPDLYVWMPSMPDFKLIVECDGFAHHSGRTAFSNDRVRDRELQRNGYQVLRFSGHEIYHNPVGKGIELFEYLMEIKGKANAK